MVKQVALLAALFLFFYCTPTASGQQQMNAALSRQIDSLAVEDQKPTKATDGHGPEAFQAVIHRNFPLVKHIFETYGFPGYDLVGKESSHHYWLLVQHSDFDVAFQKQVLTAMKVQVDKRNAVGQDYAYLVDRINLNEGGQQVYGTQVIMGLHGTKLKPCTDTLHLDERRAAVGLQPLKEYLKQCDEAFYELNKAHMKELLAADSAAKAGH